MISKCRCLEPPEKELNQPFELVRLEVFRAGCNSTHQAGNATKAETNRFIKCTPFALGAADAFRLRRYRAEPGIAPPSGCALGGAGYLAYPIHNVSTAWGLVVLVFARYGLERCNFVFSAAAALADSIDAISDPWTGATIAAPLVIVGVALAARNRSNRLGAAVFGLSLTTAVALRAARTRFFGVLDFLPKSHFEVPTMLFNLRWGYRAFGEIFKIVPSAGLAATPSRLVNGFAPIGAVGAATLGGLRTSSLGRQLVAVHPPVNICHRLPVPPRAMGRTFSSGAFSQISISWAGSWWPSSQLSTGETGRAQQRPASRVTLAYSLSLEC